jgi:hypothetical protein
MPQVPQLNLLPPAPSIQPPIQNILGPIQNPNNSVSQTNRNNEAFWFATVDSQSANGNFSSISTQQLEVTSGVIGLSGPTFISTIGTNLFYFNGSVLEQLTSVSSLSSIAEWSYEPAISTVQMAGEDLLGANVVGASNVSSLVGTFSSITANNIFTQNLFVQSTITTVNFISTTNVVADNVYASNLTSTLALEASTFNGYTVSDFLSTSAVVANIIASTITASEFVSTPEVFLSSINGLSIGSITGDTSNWATFSANSTINCAGNPIFSGSGATTDLTLNGSRYLNANATGVFITADEPLNPAAFTDISLTTGGGNRGRIQLTANPGLTGINGEVNIVANGGSDSGIILGGVVNITANTPLGPSPTATSAVKINAASVASYAGAVPVIGSLAGYNYVYGQLGTSILAGLPSVIPNTVGTVYAYGLTGVTLESGFGSDVEVKDSDFAALSIRPRTSILVNFGDLNITGRINLVAPNQYVNMSNVKRIDFENGTLAAINNLSTLNGQPISFYEPTPAISTFNNLFTDTLDVSTINTIGSGFINWQGGASMYETGPNSLFITNGAGTTLDIQPTGFTFTEAGSGGTMSFTNNLLTVPAISTNNLQAVDSILTSNLTTSTINGFTFPTALVSSFDSLTTSTLTLSPSTILRGDLTGSVLEVLESAVPTNYGQVAAQAYTMAATTTASNGTFIYQDILDKPGFINNSGTTNTLAYLANESLSVSSLGVSTIVGNFGDIQNLFTENIASSDPLASGISGFSSLQVESGTISTLTVSTINSQPYIGFRGGQFYRSVNQNLPTGNNNLIFDTAKPWNSADFIQTNPSTFLCSTTGTYQIGINNTVVSATGTWTALNKSIFIQQDRGGAQNVVVNSTSIPNATAYGQSASAVIDIDQGDFLRFLTGQTLTGGSTISLGVSSIIDLNSFWDYQLLRTG